VRNLLKNERAYQYYTSRAVKLHYFNAKGKEFKMMAVVEGFGVMISKRQETLRSESTRVAEELGSSFGVIRVLKFNAMSRSGLIHPQQKNIF
jgi:hypothetical protein